MKLNHLAEQRDTVLRVFAKLLDDKTLAALWESGRYTTTPDGFKTRTIPDGGSPGSDPTSSVESAALSGLGDPSPWSAWSVEQRGVGAADPDRFDGRHRFPADPLGDAVGDVIGRLQTIAASCARIEKRLTYIHAAGDAIRGRANTVELCTACSTMILGRAHRIDGQPYHDGAGFDPLTGAKLHPDCYQAANRERRRIAVTYGEPVLGPAPEAPGCSAGHRCCAGMAAAGTLHTHWVAPAECPGCAELTT